MGTQTIYAYTNLKTKKSQRRREIDRYRDGTKIIYINIFIHIN